MIRISPFVIRGRCSQLALLRSLNGTSALARELAFSTYIPSGPTSRASGVAHVLPCSQTIIARFYKPNSSPARIRNMSTEPSKKDWSASQYLKFGDERTRPVFDLVSQVAPHIKAQNPRIYDLGCGPGNSTKVLLDAFPGANITGMDSSPDMLSKASASLPEVEFVKGDLGTFAPKDGEAVDLLFSNAVFHWLRSPTRIETLTRLFQTLRPGGVLAIQVPDNYDEHSHRLMRDVATQEGAPWYPYFAHSQVGSFEDKSRPDLDPMEPAHTFYDALSPHAASVNLWRTEYQHVLKDAGAIVEWVKGTGLQPYLQKIEQEGPKRAFLEEYEKRLAKAYPELVDGKVLLGYPRLFVVAVRQ